MGEKEPTALQRVQGMAARERQLSVMTFKIRAFVAAPNVHLSAQLQLPESEVLVWATGAGGSKHPAIALVGMGRKEHRAGEKGAL